MPLVFVFSDLFHNCEKFLNPLLKGDPQASCGSFRRLFRSGHDNRAETTADPVQIRLSEDGQITGS